LCEGSDGRGVELGEVLGGEVEDDFGYVADDVPEHTFASLALFFGCLTFLLGFGFEQGEALLVEGEASGVEVGTAEGHDVGGQVVEATEFGSGIILGRREGVGGGGVAQEKPVGEVFQDLGAGRELGVGAFTGGFFGQGLREFEGILAEFPVAKAVLGPVMEVLFGDGFGVEVLGEDGLNFGESVKPSEDGLVGLGVVKAAVDLVAERVREASDFSEHSFDKSG